MISVAAISVIGVGLSFALRPREVIVEVPVAVVDAGVEPLAVIDDAATEFVDFPDASVMVADVIDAGAEEDAGVVAVVDPGVKRPGKKKGRVNVITTHAGEPYWAQVSIDGVPRGRTPLLLDLPVGKYQVLIERPGFRSLSREIRVAGGRAVVVKLELVP